MSDHPETIPACLEVPALRWFFPLLSVAIAGSKEVDDDADRGGEDDIDVHGGQAGVVHCRVR